jgi:hypothetical protein
MTYMGKPYYPWWLDNAAGKAQHLAVLHRPRSSVLLFSRLMGKRYTGTPLAQYFITSES